jgi:sulfotransferase
MINMKNFSFLSGLPRSGSTLMTALLNQHPDVHASATSALLELLISQAGAMQAQRKYYEISDRQEIDIHLGIMESFYQHVYKKNIIDKHRSWPSIIYPMRRLGIEPKIICSNRPVAEIIASYILLINRHPEEPNNIDSILASRNLPLNLLNRAMVIWSDYIQRPHFILSEALKNNRDNILLFNYEELVTGPGETLVKVEDFLGLNPFNEYQFSNVKNDQPDKDEGWGLKGLHEIRPKIEKTSPPAEEILGKELVSYFSQFDLTNETKQ